MRCISLRIIVGLLSVFIVTKLAPTPAAADYCACSCGSCEEHTPTPMWCEYKCGARQQYTLECISWYWDCHGGDHYPGPTCDTGIPCGGPGGGGDDDGSDPPSCTATAPGAPTLMSPADGVVVPTTPVTLQWEAPLGWGTQCTNSATKTYTVCVGTNQATVQALDIGSNWTAGCDASLQNSITTTSTNVTLTSGTYYWKVASFNGDLLKPSVTWSLQVPAMTAVTGHVYASNDLTCGGTTPATGYTGGTMIMGANATSGYAGSTQTDVLSSATFTVPGNTTAGYQYSLGFANDDTNWIMKCPLPSNYTVNVKDQPIEESFYVTQIADPWRQVAA